jgi:flagellar hook-associated protein 3 FlgL
MTSISTTLSTFTAAKFRRDTVADIQQRLDRAGQEMSTGRKADVYAALGPRAGELLTVRSSAASNENFLVGNRLIANKLDLTAASLSGVRDTLQDFLNIAIANRASPGTDGGRRSRNPPRAAYGQVVAQLNAVYQGAHLFSGTESCAYALADLGSGERLTTGLAPSDVLANIVGAQITDATDAQAKLADGPGGVHKHQRCGPADEFRGDVLQRDAASGRRGGSVPADDGDGSTMRRC